MTLSNVNEAKTMFVAPHVSEPKSFQFALTVMDRGAGRGEKSDFFAIL